ncbi:NAD(P)-binding protein [Mycena epipterygia]|nr:NAD(P)-binding protein [Mycena epipterygia]
MTITQNSSAPLIAVVGATGIQGGSVIKALEESDKPYRIRAFTRDATKPAAHELTKKGVEVVTISLVVENTKEVYQAFAGANMAFLLTSFWEHMDVDKEVAEAKLLIDAAKAGGASRVVWSGLTSMKKISAGKYVHVINFDSKAGIADYGRQSGVPFVDVQAGWYANNFHDSPFTPLVKQDDGSYLMEWPVKPTMTVPLIDTANDYGLYVRQVLEQPVFPDGSEVRTGVNITAQDLATQLSRGTGKKIVFKQITIEQFEKQIQNLGLPLHLVLSMREVFQTWNEFGYYGTKATSSLEGLARKPRTWAEFIETADWSKILV